MDEQTTRELYSQLQDRLILNLKKNEIPCPECKGLRFLFVEENNNSYIESCRRCYTGKLYICKHCGNGYKSMCDCKASQNERDNDFNSEQAKKEFECYQKAEKIDYKEYDGHFILPDSEYLKDIDDVAEWIYEKLEDGDDVPEYLWAVEGTPHFSLDIKVIIYDKCEDGYEDMYSHLDTKSSLLSQAQDLIDQWEKEQGESLYIFNETCKKAVIIKNLVEEVRKELNSK